MAKYDVTDGFCAPGLGDILPSDSPVEMNERDALPYVIQGRLVPHVAKVGGEHRDPAASRHEPRTETR